MTPGVMPITGCVTWQGTFDSCLTQHATRTQQHATRRKLQYEPRFLGTTLSD